MVRTDFESERKYDQEQFSARSVFQSSNMKVVLGYFEPGQFIPVHAPGSDVTIAPRSGRAHVREGEEEHEIGDGDVVVVEAGSDRGIKALGEDRLEALLVTAPPPSDAEHAPVRKGLRENEFDPSA